jgi:hypothetical protein
VGFLLFLAGYFLATSISPNVDGPTRRIFGRSNFRSKYRSLTLAARKNALLNRDREGVGMGLRLTKGDENLGERYAR